MNIEKSLQVLRAARMETRDATLGQVYAMLAELVLALAALESDQGLMMHRVRDLEEMMRRWEGGPSSTM